MVLTQEISALPKTLADFMLWEPEDGNNGAAAADRPQRPGLATAHRTGGPACPRGTNGTTGN